MEYYSYDKDEWVMLGIYEGTADFYGITLYLQGGYLPSGTAPENGSNNYAWGKIDDAGKYKIYTQELHIARDL